MKTIRLRYWLLLLCTSLWLKAAGADETEIYFADKSGDVPPNVLFVIDASGSMSIPVVGDTLNRSRLQVLQDTFTQVIKAAPSNLNVGLMHYANAMLDSSSPYYWNSIKGVNFPVTNIEQDASALLASTQSFDNLPNPTAGQKVRDFLASVVQSWSANGYTPIVDALYEAARYYRGDPIGWGADNPLLAWSAHPATYGEVVSCAVPTRLESCILTIGQCTGTIDSCSAPVQQPICCAPAADGSCPDGNMTCGYSVQTCNQLVCDQLSTVIDNKNYKSPIQYSCQANYLVLMSDGKPEYPYYVGQADGTSFYPPSVQVPSVYPDQVKVTQQIPAYIGKTCVDKPLGYASGTCGSDLTNWLATTDNNATLEGDQTIQTYTVGFAMAEEPLGKAYLQSLATTPDGFFDANNNTQLAAAFSAILNKVSKASLSFSPPTYSVDQTNLIAHSDEVYIPAFDRELTVLWPGNLKKFKRNAKGEIVDATGASVLNARGEFLKSARDIWATAAVKADTSLDGADVTVGGAANSLPLPNLRKLYTDVNNVTPSMSSPQVLTDLTNTLDKSNVGTGKFISKALLGDAAMTDMQAQALLDFARGWSKTPDPVTGQYTPRYHMGDMLNTKPLIVDYGTSGKRIFAATNEGFLHSIDTATGVEQWAFMPKTFLKNIKTFYDNTQTKTHLYGFDGALTLWNYDSDNNGKIDNSNDKRILFFGLRRGGNAYYALDITLSDQPKILWRKSPGDGAAWDRLGETWSKPSLAVMRIGTATANQLKTVLVFGAGYDPAKDKETSRLPDQLGLDVMIVDALDGTLYWSLVNNLYAGNLSASPIKDSIPNDIRVMDMDRNGALDRLYFADTGGNVWRVDMDIDVRDGGTTLYDYSKARLTKLASLGLDTSGSTLDKRKFFYEPDVALMQYSGKTVMTIALGSGYRTHPLNTGIKDRFYVLLEPNVYTEAPADFTAITNADLQAARNVDGTVNEFSLLTGSVKGWYYDLTYKGEKVLAPAVTFMNKVIFTTFAPVNEKGQGVSADPCEVPPNSARAYVLNLLTSKPVANLDRDTATGSSGGKDDYVISGINEIPSVAQVIFRQPTALNGQADTACTADDCNQTVELHIGKMNLPIMDDTNSTAGGATVQSIAETVDMTNILPRMFWRDQDLQPQPINH